MSDDHTDYNKIPPEWLTINFKDVDVLLVGPAGIQPDGTFDLFDSTATGPLATRFRWVLETSRSQNPGIKIFVSQWWGIGPKIWGASLSVLDGSEAIEKYTASVRSFLEKWLPVAGGVDGFDIDYEDNNVTSNTPAIFSKIRSQLDALSSESGGRPFYVTVSPASLEYLEDVVQFLSYVNMQTYEGGSYLTPDAYLKLGLRPQQLLYGICPESGGAPPTVQQAEENYSEFALAGIHLWRLNSGNYVYEQQVQAQVYAFLHPQRDYEEE